MASAAEAAAGRACSACTYLCEDTELINCELCGCELPPLRNARPLQLAQPSKAYLPLEQPPKAQRPRVCCSWKMDNGKECQWSGRKCDLLDHQRSARCHSERRAAAARDKAATGRLFSISTGKHSGIVSSSSMEQPLSPLSHMDMTQSSNKGPNGESNGESTTSATATSKTGTSTTSWLHGSLTSLVQNVRSIYTTMRTQPEAVADAVMLRLDERERVREQERDKDAATRAGDKARSDLDKQLTECRQPEDFKKVGFNYSPEDQELHCDTCIRFRHLVHSSQICFYNHNRFAKVRLCHSRLRVFFSPFGCHPTFLQVLPPCHLAAIRPPPHCSKILSNPASRPDISCACWHGHRGEQEEGQTTVGQGQADHQAAPHSTNPPQPH